MSSTRFFWIKLLVGLLLLAGLFVATVVWLNVRGESPMTDVVSAAAPNPELVSRGAYLARAANCASCHTARGGEVYAGGKALPTPFGLVFAGNLTPDNETGIGRWSADHFWRALHHGRSRDGRLLYPAFPYTEYTHVTREDSDALYAFLRTVPAVHQPNQAHDLRFPYRTQAALAVWRALYFSPGEFEPERAKSAEWNRGAYLVRGLGHCAACHAPRNAMGATQNNLGLDGGLMPMQNWYAPSLASPAEAGVQDWSMQEVVDLLKTGVSAKGAAMGPMAEVVYSSTQHLSEADLQAMATFLRELPPHAPAPQPNTHVGSTVRELGAKLYKAQCAECHGDSGEGRDGIYPALAGHRTITQASSANLIKIIVHGGFPPTTSGNPRPYGMPPFGQSLNNEEIAALSSYVRSAWGNKASGVTPFDVNRVRR
ncbi:c-type cytochrome [Ottowia thiooxydans]|uniref:c-type cytochrome n=1 Tax=Ottowia thiooxydans TaxID=219182 RepID=UPI00055BAC4D|nr:c-type cytochrome [Ottowia thiooxydans]